MELMWLSRDHEALRYVEGADDFGGALRYYYNVFGS